MKVPVPIYFGCHLEVGHYYFHAGMVTYYAGMSACKWLHYLDGLLVPPGEKEGVATVSHIWGYTILAFADRSIDKRPGSNSAFVLAGTLTFKEAENSARALFPEVFVRFTFPVVKWQ